MPDSGPTVFIRVTVELVASGGGMRGTRMVDEKIDVLELVRAIRGGEPLARAIIREKAALSANELTDKVLKQGGL